MPKRVQNKYNSSDDSLPSKSNSRRMNQGKKIKSQVKFPGRPPTKKKSQERDHQESELQGLSEDMRSVEQIPEYSKESPHTLIIEAFINFFEAIGEEKGLVFTENERKELIAKSKHDSELSKIKWTARHEWNLDRETNKIHVAGRMCAINLEDKKYHFLFQALIGASAIFAQEFTPQVYRILLNIYLILTNQQTIQQRKSNGNKKAQMKVETRPLLKQFHEKIEENNEEDNEEYKEIKQNEMKAEENDKMSKLDELADNICDNRNRNYYMLSFQFKKLKVRANHKKKEPKVIQRQEVYRALIGEIYQIMKKMEERRPLQK